MTAVQDDASNQSEALAERRGLFSKLPPLAMHTPRKRAKTDSSESPNTRQDSHAVIPTSASQAATSIGAALSKVRSKKSSQEKAPSIGDKVRMGTPELLGRTCPVAWVDFKPSTGTSINEDIDGEFISPGTRPSQAGVLPDRTPDEKDSADALLKAQEAAKVKAEEKQRSRDEKALITAVHAARTPSAKPTRPSLTVNTSFGEWKSEQSKCQADSASHENAPNSSLLETVTADTAIAPLGPSSATASGSTTASNDWNPADPGHDTWRENAFGERQKLRIKVVADMSSFNWRSAFKRSKTPPEPALSPTDRDPGEPRDVGGLTKPTSVPESAPPRRPSTSITDHGSICRDFAILSLETESPRARARDSLENHPSTSPLSSSPDLNYLGQPLSAMLPSDNIPTAPRPSLEGGGEYESEEEEGPLAPPPSICFQNLNSNLNVHHPLGLGRSNSRHRRSPTPTTSELNEIIRCRGESIGLPNISQSPHVLAAGFEKAGRSVYRSAGCGEKFTICENRGPSGAPRLLHSVDESGEGSEGKKGRNRGETV